MTTAVRALNRAQADELTTGRALAHLAFLERPPLKLSMIFAQYEGESQPQGTEEAQRATAASAAAFVAHDYGADRSEDEVHQKYENQNAVHQSPCVMEALTKISSQASAR
jgi:hypothetical protein